MESLHGITDPIFYFAVLAAIFSAASVAAFHFQRVNRAYRFSAAGFATLLAIACLFSVLRNLQAQTMYTAGYLQASASLIAAEQATILAESNALPASYRFLAALPPSHGGIAGLSTAEIATWRAHKLESARSGAEAYAKSARACRDKGNSLRIDLSEIYHSVHQPL